MGKLILASERVVRKIYHGASAVDMDTKLSEFSVSLAAFRGKSGTFGRGFIWNDPMLAKGGRAHEWHDIYSYPFHKVFGDVARKVQAQLTGPGGGERNWQKLKFVWDSKRHKLGTDKAEKEVRIYEGHCREMEEYTMEPAEMPLHRMWSAEEGDYNLGLDKYGVVLNMEADRTTTFRCYEEDWEKEARTKKLAIHEFRLLQKYKGVRFFDEDEDQVYEIFANNLEWQKKIGKDPTTPCYVVMAKPINNDSNDEGAAEDASDDGEELESYRINDALFAMIKDLRSGHPDTFRIEEKEEEEEE